MGAINLKHTGGGSDVTLSSDGTSLLLNGTAVGGSDLELYAENPSTPTAPSATGTNAVAIGSGSSAGVTDSIAIGGTAYVGNSYAIALGYDARVSGGDGGTALGRNSRSANADAIAIGKSYASGASSFAAIIGNNTSSYGATGADSIAIGYLARSHTNTRGTAVGYQANVGGNHASAYGHQANAGGAGANAVGYGSNASGSFSSAVGYSAQGSGSNAVALGQSNASGNHSFSAVHADTGTTYGAQGDYSVAMGYHTKTTAQGAIAIGFESEATANYAVALGQSAAAGQHSFSAVINAVGSTLYGATGANSIAIGKQAKATQDRGVAIGSGAVVQGTGRYGGVAISANNLGTATVNNSGAVAIGESCTASANESIALGKGATTAGITAVALGDSRAGGQDSLAAAIANNSSSYGAKSTYGIAIGRNATANGQESTAIGGQYATAAAYSIALGHIEANGTAAIGLGASSSNYRGNAGGTGSIAIGWGRAAASNPVASGEGSVALQHGRALQKGKFAFAYDARGDNAVAQTGIFVLRANTTNATSVALTTNSADINPASTDNQVILPNNSVYGFTGTVIAREDSSSTNDFAVWEVKGGAVRAGSASTTTLGSYNINVISKSTGAANWDIALSADTTNGAVAITVTGEASHNIRWVATINTTEVTY